MTENIPQTSASERVEAARKLADHLEQMMTTAQWMPASEGIQAVHVLRSLITPPPVGESEENAVDRILAEWWRAHDYRIHIEHAMILAYRAGIQSAHESWEPADVPSQEFMLRHLGLRYSDAGRPTHIHIPFQNIEKEVI